MGRPGCEIGECISEDGSLESCGELDIELTAGIGKGRFRTGATEYGVVISEILQIPIPGHYRSRVSGVDLVS